MNNAQRIFLGFLAVWGAAALWIFAFNAGRGSHPARQLPSPCQAPQGLSNSGATTFYAGMYWTCDNGVWDTTGVQQ